MALFEVQEHIVIDALADVVRRQFADVAHHAAAGVHHGVVFRVLEQDATRCRYEQVTHVGPLRSHQEFELELVDEGPLVNKVTKGQFSGGTLSFDFAGKNAVPTWVGATTEEASHVQTTVVTATLSAPLRFPLSLAVPVLRRIVGRALAAALVEDKADIESGRYEPH